MIVAQCNDKDILYQFIAMFGRKTECQMTVSNCSIVPLSLSLKCATIQAENLVTDVVADESATKEAGINERSKKRKQNVIFFILLTVSL